MFKKSLLSTIAVAAMSLVASAAHASPLPSFTVYDGTTFNADTISGNYVEVVTLNNDPAQTFNVSINWIASSFLTGDGKVVVDSTNLNKTYGLYAQYKASGNYNVNSGAYQFTFAPGTGSLNIFEDVGNDTKFGLNSIPQDGTGNFTPSSNGSADVLLATGTPVAGNGYLFPVGPSNAGSFGAEAVLQLTDAGSNFFTAPVPFYPLTLQSGAFSANFTPGRSTTINGTLAVTFDVPEPGMVGLLGLGLLAATLSRRNGFKRKQG